VFEEIRKRYNLRRNRKKFERPILSTLKMEGNIAYECK
jgi:uncharacterized protein YxjI